MIVLVMITVITVSTLIMCVDKVMSKDSIESLCLNASAVKQQVWTDFVNCSVTNENAAF